MKKKTNPELEKIKDILSHLKRGRILDLGCGEGDYAKMLHDLGFEVIANDLDEAGFKYKDEIEFKKKRYYSRIKFHGQLF